MTTVTPSLHERVQACSRAPRTLLLSFVHASTDDDGEPRVTSPLYRVVVYVRVIAPSRFDNTRYGVNVEAFRARSRPMAGFLARARAFGLRL